ncbi:MAG: hypothetical protein IJ397_00610 [Lachnospiraceae bacterium]|nr:hypothetical protein [Lachnospiraceae bacterium]
MSQTLKKKNIIANIIFLAVSAGLILFAFWALHDIQTAQGAGLYLALMQNAPDRQPYDLLIDSLGGLGMVLTTLLPVIFLKKITPGSYLRFLCIYLAFVPMINPGTLVHINEQFSQWKLCTFSSFTDILHSFASLADLLVIILPLLLILLTFSAKEDKLQLKIHSKVLLIITAVMSAIYVLFPGISEYSLFLAYFCMVILLFEEGEKLQERMSSKKWLIWLLYILCGLKGIYRIIMLLQTTHL